MARRLFGTTEEVVGRSFSLNYIDYRVCGVVRSASYLTSKSYAQLYVPYTVSPDYSSPKYNLPYLGAFNATFLVKDGKQGDALRAEIKEICRKENLMHPDEWQVDFWEQPTSHLLSVFKTYAGMEFDLWATVRHFLLVLLVLLLVPALNLSGMISSRMEGRLAEMGVRKSFGAGRKILLSQVMWENLLLTAQGGALGLLLAWLALYTGREWIFTVLDSWPGMVPEGVDVRVSGEMLFAPLDFSRSIGAVCRTESVVGPYTGVVFLAETDCELTEWKNDKTREVGMFKLIWKNLWARRRKNGWLLAELILVSIISWVVLDPVIVVTHDRNIPLGYDAERLCLISLGALQPQAPGYDAEAQDSATLVDNYYNLVRYVKDFDGVESATPVLGFCYPNSSGSSNSQLFAEGDTIPLSI